MCESAMGTPKTGTVFEPAFSVSDIGNNLLSVFSIYHKSIRNKKVWWCYYSSREMI